MTDNPEVANSLETCGYRTNYHDMGNGDPVVLLHGSGAGVSGWAITRRRIADGAFAGAMAVGAFIWWLVSESVPGWWSNILPYVVVLLVLVFFAQRLREPAAIGQSYRRGGN